MRDRVGRLTVDGTPYDLRLHPHRSTPYRPSYELVWPTYDFTVPGSEGKIVGDPNLRLWHIDSWSGGEGEDLWKPDTDRYDYSTNCRPSPSGEGLILGAAQSTTVNKTPGTFADGGAFGLAHGKLWAGLDTTVHSWDSALNQWEIAGWTTGGAGEVTSIADCDDALNLVVGNSADKKLYKVPAAGGAALGAACTNVPVVCAFDGVVYCLDGSDLSTVNLATGARTTVADLAGSSATYLALGAVSWNRLACSDVGPVWLQVLDNGQCFIWQYNVALDTDSRIGKLPVDFTVPYSVYWAHGFTFVGFRYASTHTQAGEAFIYYQRGSQRGVAGPIRDPSGVSASTPVLVGGMIGDDLIVYFDGAVWGYNLSTGGVYQLGEALTTSHTAVRQCVTFGKDVFLSHTNNTGNVERFDTQTYTTGTARWASGRFDFGYQGIDKILLDVTVVTEPLPALTSMTCAVSVEGGTAAALTGTFTGDGTSTAYTWTASTPASSLVGRDFEVHLIPASTSAAVTPTVRSVTVRAAGAERQRSWDLELDAGTWLGSSEGMSPRSADVLAGLKAIGEHNGLVTFTNPWDVEEHQTPVDYTVLVVSQQTTEAEGQPIAVLRLRESSYV